MKDYYVYGLKDENEKIFYVGITKNLSIRIREHVNHAKKSKSRGAKVAKIRRILAAGKTLQYISKGGLTIDEAKNTERRIIAANNLTNIRPGGEVVVNQPRTRKKPKPYKHKKACKHCGFKFSRLGKHKCPYKSLPTGLKSCPKCNMARELCHFSDHIRSFDGLQSVCKFCS